MLFSVHHAALSYWFGAGPKRKFPAGQVERWEHLILIQASNDLFPFILLLESLAIIYYKTRKGKNESRVQYLQAKCVIEDEVFRHDVRPLMGLH